MIDAKLSLSLAQRVDAACDRFEEEWRSGRQPRVEDYLAVAPVADRDALRGALLDVEMELRFGAEQSLRAEPGRERAAEQPATNPTWPRMVAGYEALSELGRGGMGIVYLARQPGLDRPVALKLILAGAHASAADRGRFRREAQALARLQHPNVVQVFEVGEHDDNPYLVLEYVPGGSLAGRLDGTPLPARQAARLVQSLAGAAEAAHRAGILHRDLKPANVLLAGEPAAELEQCIPKITDFGLAKCLDTQTAPTQSGVVLGTPSYMAPEQAQGNKDAGPVADVYSLGAILYELLTGRPPFRGPTPLETVFQVVGDDPVLPRLLQPRLPRDAETICLKCLHKDPAQRYASASDLADDLGRFLSGEPIRARPTGWAERLVRWCRRNPLLAVLTAALVLVLAGGVAGVTSFWMMARDQRDRAERNFDRVFEAIDRSFTRVSDSQELKTDELGPFRKRLLTAAQQQYQGFVAELRTNPRAENALVRSWIRLAQINRRLGNKSEAEQAARTSVVLGEKLVGKAPTAENRALLSWAWEEQMLTAMDAGEQRRATQHILELLEEAREDPANESVRFPLARTCYNAGLGHDETGNDKEALVWLRRARDLLAPRIAAGAGPLEVDEFRVQVLQHLARLEAGRSGRGPGEALACCQQAIDLAGRLAREHPREGRLVIHLADALIEQNLVRSQAKKPSGECIASLVHAGEVLDQVLAANVPSVEVRTRALLTRAMVAYNLSFDYLEIGQTAQGRAALKQTRELCAKLLLIYPDKTELHHWLASSCTRLALLGEQPEQAVNLLQEAIEQQRQACIKEPKSAEYRLALAEQLLQLAAVQRSLNRLSEAVAAAVEAGQRYHDRPAELYQVAVELARSMNRVGEGRAVLAPEQQAQRERYARHLLQTLKAAVDAGYRDADVLRKEPTFAWVRDRDDFRQLLTSAGSPR